MPANEPEIYKLFRLMEKYKSSDLHLKSNSPPVLRVAGSLRKLDLPPLSAQQVWELISEILSPDQADNLTKTGNMDLAHAFENNSGKLARVRINAFRQRGDISLVARLVNTLVPTFEELHLPGDTFRKLAQLEDGLILVAGITGSGKSTTLAAMVDYINSHRRCHIVTIEDPIEYLHANKRCVIDQREVGADTHNFAEALKHVLRQDPDVVLV
ncbi:MAG: ATPase, T2SS/T4P/T4SS family, partial [Planctomycetota bacterium]|nr:ATPase, T2SS/T4P/T4SS family [Planctomycetota bacterium]